MAAEEGRQALEPTPVRVRVGVHTGEPTPTDEGYVGVDVHTAARIAAAGHGGQVLVSERTAGFLEPGNSPVLADLGLHRLKDLGRPLRLFQLGDGAFPPLRSLNATNLPAQPSPLVGRERELQDLAQLVRSGARVVTVAGPGGTGKTRLALQAAAELTDEFPDGVFWVPLQALTDPQLVLPTVASTLGAKGELVEHVDEKRLLLLLDNLEQLLPAAAEPLSELLAACPNLQLLVTSRALLRIAGEREYPLEPLPLADAVALFRERAANAEPEDAVSEICRRLDGLPLAVELAAARTRILPPEKLLERLEKALPVLTGGARDAPERQRTLTATIRWSYDLLDGDEQRLFRRLAVFAGGFELEAAEEVCEADLDTLESLLEKSLLRRWSSGRLGMLETIREFALERLEESAQADDCCARLAAWACTLADSASRQGSRNPTSAVQSELPNLRIALDWADRAADASALFRLCRGLSRVWIFFGPIDEGKRWVAKALDEPSYGSAERGELLETAAALAMQTGASSEATSFLEERSRVARASADARGEAYALRNLAVVAMLRGELDRSRRLHCESLAVARRLRDDTVLAAAVGDQALLELEAGDYAAAYAGSLEAERLARATGIDGIVPISLSNAGCAALMLGDLESARKHLGAAMALFVGREQWHGAAAILPAFAAVALASGREDDAGRLVGACLAACDRLGLALMPFDARLLETSTERLRERVGGERQAELLREGQSLELTDAVTLNRYLDSS